MKIRDDFALVSSSACLWRLSLLAATASCVVIGDVDDSDTDHHRAIVASSIEELGNSGAYGDSYDYGQTNGLLGIEEQQDVGDYAQKEVLKPVYRYTGEPDTDYAAEEVAASEERPAQWNAVGEAANQNDYAHEGDTEDAAEDAPAFGDPSDSAALATMATAATAPAATVAVAAPASTVAATAATAVEATPPASTVASATVASLPSQPKPGTLQEFLWNSDEEMKKVAIESIEPGVTSKFRCSNNNRAPCKEGGSVDQKCKRDETCELGAWREKHKGPWMPCCKKFALFELMVWFNNAMGKVDDDGNGFWWALNGGTLLGSLRSEDVIDWTTDLDVIVPKEYEELVTKRLKAGMEKADKTYGFSITSSTDQKDTRRMNFDNNGALIDIFFAHGYNEGDEKNAKEVFKNNDTRGGMGTGHVLPLTSVANRSMQESGQAPPCIKYWGDTFPGKWLFPLRRCKIQGAEFPCIKESEEMLKFNYGENWKTPDGAKPPEARWQCGDPT